MKRACMKRMCEFFFISTTLLVLGAMNASADPLKGDGKIYSGIGCTEAPANVIVPKDTDPYGENDVRYNDRGWAYNSSMTDEIFVSCPIVREYASNPIKRIFVTVLNDTVGTVFCKVETFNFRGEFVEASSVLQWLPREQEDPNNYFPITKLVSNDPKDNDGGLSAPYTSNAGGYYLLQCFMPPLYQAIGTTPQSVDAAYIVRYLVEEVSN